jgi:hypothetical protein
MAASPLRAGALLAVLALSAGSILPGPSPCGDPTTTLSTTHSGGVFSHASAGSLLSGSSPSCGQPTTALSTLSGGVFFHGSAVSAGSTTTLSSLLRGEPPTTLSTTLSGGVCFFGWCRCRFFACPFLLARGCFGSSRSSRSFPSACFSSLVLAGA